MAHHGDIGWGIAVRRGDRVGVQVEDHICTGLARNLLGQPGVGGHIQKDGGRAGIVDLVNQPGQFLGAGAGPGAETGTIAPMMVNPYWSAK
jgi:hypothetical protein